jgi:hypothetical protein
MTWTDVTMQYLQDIQRYIKTCLTNWTPPYKDI